MFELRHIIERLRVTHLIGFAGYALSGKTAAADATERIARRHGHDVMRLRFAQGLVDGLACMGIYKHKHPDLYRRVSQKMGTDIIRTEEPDWWIPLFEEQLPNYPCVVIVDNVRFANESACIKRHGGTLVSIDAQKRLDLSQPMYRHESEDFARFLAIIYDCGCLPVIDNNADEASFIARVEAFAEATLNDAVTV